MRIEFVVVAAAAFERQAEESGAHRVHAIDHVGHAVLLLDDAALLVLHVQPIERRRQALFLGGVGQQVAGQLPGDELVERQILVERLDDPVAVGPHRPVAVHLVAVRVGVPGQVQPVGRHPLAVARRRQQPVDDFLVGSGDLSARKASISSASAAGRSGRASRGGSTFPCVASGAGLSLSCLQIGARTNASIPLMRPAFAFASAEGSGRSGGTNAQCWLHFAPWSTHRLQHLDLLRRQLAIRLRRRHPLLGIGAGDPPDQFALAAFARDDDGLAIFDAERPFLGVEPKLRLARLLVRAVALITVVRKDRQDVAAEIDLVALRLRSTPRMQ